MVDQNMLNKAQELMDRFGGIATPPNLFKGYGNPNDQKNQFPVQLGSTDPADRKFALQNQLVGAGNKSGAVPGYGQAVVGDEFFSWAKRKQDQAVLHDFYGYMMNNADLTKPESAQWWFTKFPWMKDMRLREIEREAEVQKRLAKIQVCGPESDEDFMVLYMIDQGLLKKSDKPLYRLHEDSPPYKEPKQFKAGYWNPFAKNPLPGDIPNQNVNWSGPITKDGVGKVDPQRAGPFPTTGFDVKTALGTA